MRKIFRELSVFKKLLFSYMAILLVSVGVMIFFTNTLFVGAVRDALVQRNTDTAAALKNDIDRNIRMIDEIKNSIVLDSDYNTYFRLKDPNGVNTLKNELGKYIYTSSFIDEIALYIYGDDYLYTGTGSYSVPLFISAAYKYENWSEEELVRDLCSATEPYVRAAENVSHFGVGESPKITFVYPLVSAAIKRYGALVFIVDRDGLNTALGETAESGAPTVCITDSNGNVISAPENPAVGRDAETAETSGIRRVGGINYLISVENSRYNGWRYISYTREDYALKTAHTAQRNIVLVFIALMIICGGVIYYNTKLHYRPIKKMKDYADKVNPGGAENEISSVISTIDYLSDRNKNLVDKYTDITKEHFVDCLLRGSAADTENMEISRDGFYTVAVLHFCSGSAGVHFDKIRRLAEENNALIKEYSNGGKLVLIIPQANSEPDIEELAQLHIRIKELSGEEVTMGVGNPCGSLEDIPNSYKQAHIALDYRLVKGTGELIFYREIEENDDSLDGYPYKELKILTYRLKEGNVDETEKILRDIISYVLTCNVSLFVARMLCFDLVNTVCAAVAEMNQELILPQKYYISVDSLVKYETVWELMESMRNICTNLCSVISENKYKNKEKLTGEMIDFINKNYTDTGFSIQNMADEFGMSMTNLSQYFKNHTQKTINDYVTNLRIKKSQELLANTDKQLSEIAEETGYLNTSSFIRRFKQITGVTPGQYAKLSRQ